MRRQICIAAVGMLSAISISSWSSPAVKAEETEYVTNSKASYLSQFDAEAYIDLAEYEAIPVSAAEGDTAGIQNDIGDYLLEHSSFLQELPQPFVNRNTATLKDELQNYADTYGMALEDFMKFYDPALTEDTYESYIEELGLAYSQKLVAMQAVAGEEDLEVTDEELDAQIAKQAEAAGFSSISEYKKAVKMDPEELREVMMSTRVLEFLQEKVIYETEKSETSTEQEEES